MTSKRGGQRRVHYLITVVEFDEPVTITEALMEVRHKLLGPVVYGEKLDGTPKTFIVGALNVLAKRREE